ncbi:MAG: succinate dehydrogenase [Lachnospiraceae bacterium]|nr:succinate dehydrogenase [Lachnospiraceae bacterium]
MNYEFEILRRENSSAKPYLQNISYETENKRETVATALTNINRAAENALLDREGRRVQPIRWESGCLQKKCGACAMVVNGVPGLACDSFLEKCRKKGRIRLEPLRKFPVVADLMVDRSILFENLKTMEIWRKEAVSLDEKRRQLVYESSKCLACGCCLEICPNYSFGESFFGAAAFVPTTRLITTLKKEERESLRKAYLSHVYQGCGKSLACAVVCPAKLNVEQMLAASNALSLWRRP